MRYVLLGLLLAFILLVPGAAAARTRCGVRVPDGVPVCEPPHPQPHPRAPAPVCPLYVRERTVGCVFVDRAAPPILFVPR